MGGGGHQAEVYSGSGGGSAQTIAGGHGFLAGMASPVPVHAPVPEVPMVEKLLQRLVAETQSRQPTPMVPPEPVGFENLLRSPPGSVVRLDPRIPGEGQHG